MSQEYSQFFKKAKNHRKKVAPKNVVGSKEQTAESYLREALNVKTNKKTKKKSGPPLISMIVVLAGLVAATIGYLNLDQVEQMLGQFEVDFLGVARASGQEKPAQTAASSPAEIAGGANEKKAETCVQTKGFSEEELSHFNKLNERKEELDRREAELSELEAELHKQKDEIEQRIVKLEQIREEVANILKERVEVDQQRVSTLVDFYSNMKPKQAAEIFTKLNEDLAVEVLGKMKKKNAADIMNLLEPTKARTLSEKFAGYKRR